MSVPRLNNVKGNSGSSTSSALAPGVLKPYLELWAFLTQTTYEDGSPRRPGKLALSCESGQLGLCLTDGDTGQYAFLNGTDLELLLLDAETRLEAGTLAFKPSKYAPQGRRK